jgi:TPR repeat protein
LAILAVVSVFASWRLLAPIPGPAPEFSPAPGAYATAQTIRISDAATRGLTIYYTTNGTAPSTSSQAYTPDGIKVQQSQTIRAIAVADGYSQSAEASAAYTITPPPMPQQPGITPSPTPQQPGTTPPPTPQQPGTTPAPPLHQPTIAEIEQEALAFYNQKRYPEAAPLFEQACAGGIGEACNHLGFMHENGNGVALDNSQAIALYSKACMANYVLGCFDLGVMYEHGRGVPQDEAYVRAAAEYSIVCDANGGAGCSNLGNLYWHGGNGLVKDNEKARLYLTKGCSLGNQWGCDRLKLVH